MRLFGDDLEPATPPADPKVGEQNRDDPMMLARGGHMGTTEARVGPDPAPLPVFARWLTGDVFARLAEIPDGSVDLVVTSPPFLALRSYLPDDHPDKHLEIGTEPTPAAFVDTLLAVTAELRRVLAPHGSIAVELGDTYSGSGGAGGDYAANGLRDGQPVFAGSARNGRRSRPADEAAGILAPRPRPGPGDRDNIAGWPIAKCRAMIPQLFEVALAYGLNPLTGAESPAGRWRCRNIVTWARPNPVVGALGDKWRPATSDVTIACTSATRYWDDLATREPVMHPKAVEYHARRGGIPTDGDKGPNIDRGDLGASNFGAHPAGAPLHDAWVEPDDVVPVTLTRVGAASASRGISGGDSGNPDKLRTTRSPAGSPLHDYWVIPPGGYNGAHFAVMPPALVVPLVKAMCPHRVCQICGEPSRRLVEYRRVDRNGDTVTGDWNALNYEPGAGYTGSQGALRTTAGAAVATVVVDLGWSDCGHSAWRPGVVLDPFAGSGTTLAVAHGHGRASIGIDLDPANADLARGRLGMFLDEVPA